MTSNPSSSSTSTSCSRQSPQPPSRQLLASRCSRQCTSPRPSAGPATVEPPHGGLQCRSVCPSSVHTTCAQAKQQSLTSHSQQSTPVLSRWQTSCPPAVHVARTSQVASSSDTSQT